MSRKCRWPFGLASRRPAAASSRLNDSISLSHFAALPCIESPGDQHRRYESSGNALAQRPRKKNLPRAFLFMTDRFVALPLQVGG